MLAVLARREYNTLGKESEGAKQTDRAAWLIARTLRRPGPEVVAYHIERRNLGAANRISRRVGRGKSRVGGTGARQVSRIRPGRV